MNISKTEVLNLVDGVVFGLIVAVITAFFMYTFSVCSWVPPPTVSLVLVLFPVLLTAGELLQIEKSLQSREIDKKCRLETIGSGEPSEADKVWLADNDKAMDKLKEEKDNVLWFCYLLLFVKPVSTVLGVRR